MFGTLQQGTSPVRNQGEATASGDRWIEEVWSKGKAVNVPQLPGHLDFADLLQQTYSNPYKSAAAGDKVGDAWLTCRGKAAVPSFNGRISLAGNKCNVAVLQQACTIYRLRRMISSLGSYIAGITAVQFACPLCNNTVHVPAYYVAVCSHMLVWFSSGHVHLVGLVLTSHPCIMRAITGKHHTGNCI